MPLYLHCVICSRKQAEGLLSGSSWPKVELPREHAVEHPSVQGSSARVCPTCVVSFGDWEDRVYVSLGLNGSSA